MRSVVLASLLALAVAAPAESQPSTRLTLHPISNDGGSPVHSRIAACCS